MTTTHATPARGATTTACCGHTPFELPQTDRMSNDPERVTCGAPLTLSDLQQQVSTWHDREFPDEHGNQLPALVLCEEAGEVARAVVKGAQGIRGTAAEWLDNLGDELADVVIAACSVAASSGLDLGVVVRDRWSAVGARRFATAHPEAELVKVGDGELAEVVAQVLPAADAAAVTEYRNRVCPECSNLRRRCTCDV